MTATSDVILHESISKLGIAIRSGQITPTQLTEIALNRLETVGRDLNAVAATTPERALEAARQAEDELSHGVDRGPLHGIPYGAKDLLATKNVPTTWGAEPYSCQLFERDAVVIERLHEAGAILVAKLAMVECAGGFGYEQPNAALTGPGRNAWDSKAWAGGSSSGPGAAVASGCVPFAIGSETWGSILVPASFNGVTGFRPTYGVVDTTGAMALSWSLDKLGPLAHSADDCVRIMAAIANPEVPGAPRPISFEPGFQSPGALRIGVLSGSNGVESDVAANFEQSIKVLEEFGTLTEFTLPDLPWAEAASLIIMAEAASAFEDLIRSGESLRLTAPEDRIGLDHALSVPAVDYLRALRIRTLGARIIDEALTELDVVVAPATSCVATPIDEPFDTWFARHDAPSLGAAGNLCGLPSISVPNGFGDRGLPTSLELMGRAFDDMKVLTAAARFQDRTAWHRQHPPN